MKKLLVAFFFTIYSFTTLLAQDTLSFSSVLQQFTSSYARIDNYHCKMNTFEKAGNRTDEKVFYYYFVKPDCVHVEILEGRNKGSTATLKDGRVRAAMGGILNKFKVLLHPRSKMMLSIRGGSLDESGWGKMLESMELMNKSGWNAKCDSAGNTSWVLELSSAAPSSVYVYRYYMDPVTKLVSMSEYYENGELVERVKYEILSLNSESNGVFFK